MIAGDSSGAGSDGSDRSSVDPLGFCIDRSKVNAARDDDAGMTVDVVLSSVVRLALSSSTSVAVVPVARCTGLSPWRRFVVVVACTAEVVDRYVLRLGVLTGLLTATVRVAD